MPHAFPRREQTLNILSFVGMVFLPLCEKTISKNTFSFSYNLERDECLWSCSIHMTYSWLSSGSETLVGLLFCYS